MTGSRIYDGPHIDDGDLIRLIDGEFTKDESAQMRAHLEGCAECKRNADSLRAASGLVSRALTELDPPVPATPKVVPSVGGKLPRFEARGGFFTPRVLRAAAVLAAMSLVAAASPARAWLVQGWHALKSVVVGEVVEAPVPVEVTELPAPRISSVLRFTPRGSEFRLEFVERPQAGTVLLLFDSVATASAGTIGEDVTDEMILLPQGLRVRNSAGSTTSFEVRLPLSLTAVEVSIAGTVELRLDVGAHSEPFRSELDLSGTAGG